MEKKSVNRTLKIEMYIFAYIIITSNSNAKYRTQMDLVYQISLETTIIYFLILCWSSRVAVYTQSHSGKDIWFCLCKKNIYCREPRYLR